MTKSIATLFVTFLALNASAKAPSAVTAVADKIKISDTRTIVKEVENTDGNPCMPEGKSYTVELQVKQAYYNQLNSKVEYTWETVKTVGVEKNGLVSEVCAE